MFGAAGDAGRACESPSSAEPVRVGTPATPARGCVSGVRAFRYRFDSWKGSTIPLFREGQRYPADVWALGVVFLELLAGGGRGGGGPHPTTAAGGGVPATAGGLARQCPWRRRVCAHYAPCARAALLMVGVLCTQVCAFAWHHTFCLSRAPHVTNTLRHSG